MYLIYINRVYEAAKAVEDGESESGFKAVIARPKEKSHPSDLSMSASNTPRSANGDA